MGKKGKDRALSTQAITPGSTGLGANLLDDAQSLDSPSTPSAGVFKEIASRRKHLHGIRKKERPGEDDLPLVRRLPVSATIKSIERRQNAQSDFTELLIYVVFVILYMVIIYRQVDTYYSYQTEATMREQILNEEWNNVPPKDFYEVRKIDDFWQWMENVVIEKTWLNWVDHESFLSRYNKVISGVMVLQQRSESVSCDTDRFDHVYRTDCYATSGVFEPAYLQSSYGPNSRFDYSDKFEGFVEVLSIRNTKADVLTQLSNMKTDGWIDGHTRNLEVTIVTYNGNVGLVGMIKVEIDVTTSGYLQKYAWVRSVNVEPYLNDENYTRIYVDVAFCGLVALNLLKRFYELVAAKRRTGKFSSYFKTVWTYVDIVTLAIFFVIIAWWFVFYGITTTFRIDKQSDVVKSDWNAERSLSLIIEDLERLWSFSKYYITLNAINVMFLTLRFFGFFRHYGKMAVLTSTLTSAASDLVHFLFFFFVIFGSFAFIGYIVFGRALLEYSTVARSWQSCFELILGGFEYEKLRRVDNVGAPFFFWTIMIVVALVLLNMFIAIICDTYSRIRVDSEFQQSIFGQLYDTAVLFFRSSRDFILYYTIKRSRRFMRPGQRLRVLKTLEASSIDMCDKKTLLVKIPDGFKAETVVDKIFAEFGKDVSAEEYAEGDNEMNDRKRLQIERQLDNAIRYIDSLK